EACPFNRTAAPAAEKTAPFRPHARWGELGLDELAGLDEARWAEVALGTPLHRAGREGLARNAALVAKARLGRDPGDAEARRALERARAHEDPVVREVARDVVREVAGDPERGG